MITQTGFTALNNATQDINTDRCCKSGDDDVI